MRSRFDCDRVLARRIVVIKAGELTCLLSDEVFGSGLIRLIFRSGTSFDEALEVLIGQESGRCGTHQFLSFCLPLEGSEPSKLVCNEEAVVEEVKDSLRLNRYNRVEDIKQLRCHAYLLLVNEHLEHQLKGEWTLLVKGNMNGRCLFAWLIKPRIAMKEGKRQHVDSDIVGAVLFGHRHRILNSVQDCGVCGEVMEHRDAIREASNRTECCHNTFADLVLILVNLETLPVHQIYQRDEVVHTSWLCHIEVARPVT